MDNKSFTLDARLGLRKTQDENSEWKIFGIASSEGLDEEDDMILRSVLDIDYLKARGYINWNHYSDPEYQLGYTTDAAIIDKGDVEKYSEKLGVNLSTNSSLYIEGLLYRNLSKAGEVKNILSSVPDDAKMMHSLGLSIEGYFTRNDDWSIKKAIIRGVAITPSPAQTETMVRLAKMLNWQKEDDADTLTKTLTDDEAMLFILKKHPHMAYNSAKTIFNHIRSQQK